MWLSLLRRLIFCRSFSSRKFLCLSVLPPLLCCLRHSLFDIPCRKIISSHVAQKCPLAIIRATLCPCHSPREGCHSILTNVDHYRVLGPIITIYDYLQYRTCAKFVLPIVNERLQQLKPSNEKLPLFGRKPSVWLSPSVLSSCSPCGSQRWHIISMLTCKQNDYVQWAIGHALNHWDPVELEAAVIAKRLACLCFAAIQSSVISLTNTLFDIASSPHCAEWLAAMRDEALTEVAAASAGRAVGGGSDSRAFSPWGKATLAKMVCVDSALRESMRLNGFVARGIMKAVVAREGVRLPDGSLIPYGTKIGVQAYSIHRDEDVYVRADEYDALRFVSRVGTARQERKAGGKSDASSSSTACASGSDSEGSRVSTSSVVERKRKIGEPRASQPQALVTTSPTFLAFSHGPNSW